MNLKDVVKELLGQIEQYLEQLSAEAYSRPLDLLSRASLGQHTRHILEFFECLLSQYPSGTINYDLRQRDTRIQTDPAYALSVIRSIQSRLDFGQPELPLILEHAYNPHSEEKVQVQTTLAREWVYNVEHTIHHLAMIRIGLREAAPGVQLPPEFGVAPSTLKFQMSR